MADDQLITAALRTLNADPGASMARVAAGCGVSRATLNRRFPTREALLTELGRASCDVWEAAQDEADIDATSASGDAEAIRAALRTLIDQYLDQAETHGFALTDRFLEQVPELADRAKRLTDREIAFVATAQQAGVLRSDVPATWLSYTVFGQLVAARDALRFGDVGRRQLNDLVWATLMKGVSA